jgi:FKBP-type peptidyl-prolyl cis-trans isomerase
MLAPLAAVEPPPSATMPATLGWSIEDRMAYIMGYKAALMARKELPYSDRLPDAKIIEGFSAAINKQASVVEGDTWKAIVDSFQASCEEMEKKRTVINKAESKAYMARLRLKPEIRFTESGLGYEIVKQGGGDRPAADSQVKIHYVLKKTDGTQLESTRAVSRNPVTLSLPQCFPGLAEGLRLMSTGSTYRLHIPGELGITEKSGIPTSTGYNTAVIAEIELMEVLPPKPRGSRDGR